MKLMLIECDAEELRANRTVLDSIADAIGSFARAIAWGDKLDDENEFKEEEDQETADKEDKNESR